MPGVCAILGVGPGLGASLAQRFARDGFAIAVMSRSEKSLAGLQEEIEKAGVKVICLPNTDATNPQSVSDSFQRIRDTLGEVDVMIYNAGSFDVRGLLDTTPEQFQHHWKINCFGGFLAAQEVLPSMLARGQGTILMTGATASLRGGAKFANFAVGKFGLRALAQSLAREYSSKGIHVAHVIIDGQINTAAVQSVLPNMDPTAALDPDALAETYFQIHLQPRSVWTHEIDVRPHVEKF